MSFVVAIDGPAGSGKGTVTKLVAEKLGLVNIDTGAMYRCVSLNMIQKGVALDEIEKIEEILNNIKIEQKKINNEDKFFLNGEDVSKEIRENAVASIVSQVSHIPVVRSEMVRLQRELASGIDVVMEGRDIGTNVFPDADVKIYLDASAEERALRRVKQNEEKGIDSNYEEILNNIKMRDQNDSTSDVAPLKKADDAILIDSTHMTIEEVVEKIKSLIEIKR